MRHRLRLYNGEEHDSTATMEPPVTVKLGQISMILADAVRSRRAWLDDFDDDELQISADLYDILSAYWNLRPSA